MNILNLIPSQPKHICTNIIRQVLTGHTGSFSIRAILKNNVILSILSWIFAVAFAYFTNRAIVFESKEKDLLKEISKFVSCRLLTLGMEVVLMILFVSVLHINDMIAKIVLQIVVLVSNYLLSKLFVFVKKTSE